MSSLHNLPYQILIGSESIGGHGAFGIRIEIAHKAIDLSKRDLDAETELEKAIYHAGYDAERLIRDAVMTYALSRDPKAQEQRRAERAQLTALFPPGCYVEEIPNGYSSDWSTKHLPWFTVTTPVGRITIGWRKRVIQIDWKEIKGSLTAEEMFPDENVTKGERDIHAWTVEDAKRYIDAVIAYNPASVS